VTEQATQEGRLALSKSNAWTDLALVMPIFLGYHLGVVLLKVRNAADLVTAELTKLAESHIGLYWALTLAIGGGMVGVLWILGRGDTFDRRRFFYIALEGVLYAFVMRAAAFYVVGALTLDLPALAKGVDGRVSGVILSMGAGLYEEIAFRVALFGLGALAIRAVFGGIAKWGLTLGWAVIAACVFAGWHYVGALGDPWSFKTFAFRATCGLFLTAVYAFRGFAPAVWTHTLYDVWAMVLN
jgi:Type II CAAX prenyl endopeptidase Rce1-like